MDEKHRPRLFLAIAATLACATTGAPPTDQAATVGAPFPALTVKRLDGRGLDARALAGQVLLVDLWASWCGPCKEELPLLDAMAVRLRSKGVTILAVSLDENREDALGFLASRGADWALELAHDAEGKLAERLKPPRMPTSYIIDRGGVLRHVNSGFERADVARLEARLTRLAEQP